jgi:Predicted acetyltransferases and hydrolases with the alpha/beta hydrolase fold
MNNILSDASIKVAEGVSKIVLGKLLNSVSGGNKGEIVSYRSKGNLNVICFVHGFCGDPRSTFDPIPQFIIKEKELDGWDVLSIGYSTDLMPNIGKGIWTASPDINKIANYLITNLDILSEHYSRVALIGHSMGGLVIQRAILNRPDISKISHVLFFGTPSAGLNKAWLMKWFKNQISDMNNKGEFINSLRKEWNDKFIGEYPFRFATVAGELDEFVPTNSSLEPFPEQYRSYTSGNHITMVKPSTENDTSFQIIKKVLHSDHDFLKGFDLSALNNLIGRYHEEVNTLGKRLAELDNRGLKKYIFALEGTGKIDVAINVIEQSDAIKTNTDFMGILGGRWKRKYLLEDNIKYLNHAIQWYEEALKISLEKNISNQIYYHAINLAFLYLMRDEHDLSECKKIAQLALEHCEKSAFGDYWEVATKAEAYLYLNNFNESKRLYSEAIQKCGKDIRVMSSMMINAFYACNGLNKTDWKQELEGIFIE